MRTRQVSLTAEIIAAARAIESSRAENVRILYDPFARCFLSKPIIRSLVWFAGLFGTPDAINSVADRILGPPGLMMSFCCRTRCIDDTLNFVATACSPRSKITFTYIHRGAIDGSEHFKGVDRLTAGARRAGEPWLFGLRPEDLSKFLETRGLALLEDIGARDQQARYLVPRGRTGLLPEFTHVVTAQVS